MSGLRTSDAAPWGLKRNGAGRLVVGGCDVVDLVERHGTPLHVVDEARLRAAARGFRDTMASALGSVDVFYSYKTNCVPGILSVLHDEGLGAEAISPYETWLALRMGLPGERIVYNGVDKPVDGLRLAVSEGVRSINIDSLDEVSRLRAALGPDGPPVRVGVRVSTGAGWKAQFGVEVTSGEALRVFRELAALERVRLSGIHVHLGTCVASPETYRRALRVMLELMAAVKEETGQLLDHLDMGGGFPVPTVREFSLWDTVWHKRLRRPARAPELPGAGLEVFASEIARVRREECGRLGLPEPAMFFEPGRAVTSQAQVLLLRVGVVKERADGSRIAITDGGRSTNAMPLGNEYHEALLASRVSPDPPTPHTVVGGLCTPGDWTFVRKDLPALASGDILAIMDAGAYFTSFANNFAFARPPVLMARDGEARVVRRRESYEAMVAMDVEGLPPDPAAGSD